MHLCCETLHAQFLPLLSKHKKPQCPQTLAPVVVLSLTSVILVRSQSRTLYLWTTVRIMENSSEIVFVLQGLNHSETNRKVYFALALVSYLFTIFVNVTLVTTVCLDRALHEPLYMFLCNLCMNSIYGASTFYPKLLHDLLSETHVITYSGCMAQLFTVYSYVFCQFTCLTVMAYDRYLAICKPLQYHALMPAQRVAQLLAVTWSFSLLETTVGFTFTATLTFCGRHIRKLYCTNWEVVKLSCSESDTTINNIYGFVLILSHIAQTGLIAVSYAYLVRDALKSRASRRKFVQTCLPHLVTLVVFTLSLVFDSLYSRYGSRDSKMQALQNALAAEFLVVPPLINPIIYGINLQQIRSRILLNFNIRPETIKPAS